MMHLKRNHMKLLTENANGDQRIVKAAIEKAALQNGKSLTLQHILSEIWDVVDGPSERKPKWDTRT